MTAFTPATAPTPAAFTGVADTNLRLITYGDVPPLDGSVAYGELIGAGGFWAGAASPSVGTFTPAM